MRALLFPVLVLAAVLSGCLTNPPGKTYPCPRVVTLNPPDGGIGIPLGSDIEVSLNTPLDSSSLPPGTITLVLGTDTVPGTTSFHPGDTALVFDPADDLHPDTTYTAILTSGGGDPAGNPLDTLLIWTFTTVDTVPEPGDLVLDPGPGDVDVPLDVDVSVTLDNPVDPLHLDSNAIVLTLGTDTIPGSLTYLTGDTTLVFDPVDSLLPDTTYTVTITVPTDSMTAGGPVDTTLSWTFTTQDTVPDAPGMEYPAQGAQHVPNPKLWWYKVTGAATYGLQVSQSPLFATTIVNVAGITASGSMVSFQTTGLSPTTLYYWRVNATSSSNNTSPWSQARNFTTAP